MEEFITVHESDIPVIVGVLLHSPSGDDIDKGAIIKFQGNPHLYLVYLAVDLCGDLKKIRKMKAALMEELSAAEGLTEILKDWVECQGPQASLNHLITIFALNGLDFDASLCKAFENVKQTAKAVGNGANGAHGANGSTSNGNETEDISESDPLPSTSSHCTLDDVLEEVLEEQVSLDEHVSMDEQISLDDLVSLPSESNLLEELVAAVGNLRLPSEILQNLESSEAALLQFTLRQGTKNPLEKANLIKTVEDHRFELLKRLKFEQRSKRDELVQRLTAIKDARGPTPPPNPPASSKKKKSKKSAQSPDPSLQKKACSVAKKGPKLTLIYAQLCKGYLPLKDILSCRLANKHWQDSFHNFIQNVPLHQKFRFPQPQPFYFHRFANVLQLRQFQTDLATSPNPLFTRRVDIGDVGEGSLKEYYKELEKFLRRWGSQIWHCDIHFFLDSPPKLLTDLLQLMPNLQSSGLNLYRKYYDKLPTNVLINRGLKTAFKETEQYTLPDLNSLVHLEFCVMYDTIGDKVLSKCHQTLQTLKMTTVLSDPLEMMLKYDFPQLTFLLGMCCSGRFVINPLPRKILLPSLKEIVLIYCWLWYSSDIVTIFNNLTLIGRNCETLTLDLIKGEGYKNKFTEDFYQSMRLELPNIKVFNLAICRINFKSIDFILPMRSLKYLSITYYRLGRVLKRHNRKEQLAEDGSLTFPVEPDPALFPAGPNPHEIIEWYGKANIMYESNIWNLFPALETLTIKSGTLDWMEFGDGGEVPFVEKYYGATIQRTNVFTRQEYNKRKAAA